MQKVYIIRSVCVHVDHWYIENEILIVFISKNPNSLIKITNQIMFNFHASMKCFFFCLVLNFKNVTAVFLFLIHFLKSQHIIVIRTNNVSYTNTIDNHTNYWLYRIDLNNDSFNNNKSYTTINKREFFSSISYSIQKIIQSKPKTVND